MCFSSKNVILFCKIMLFNYCLFRNSFSPFFCFLLPLEKKYGILPVLQLLSSLKFVEIIADFLQLTFNNHNYILVNDMTLSNSMLNRVYYNREGNYFHWYSLDLELELTFRYTW